jgi:hypothetical protein
MADEIEITPEYITGFAAGWDACRAVLADTDNTGETWQTQLQAVFSATATH